MNMLNNSSKPFILFDYQQKALSECNKGDFLHSYILAKELTKYFTLYGLKPYSNPEIISKETNVFFVKNKYFKFAQSVLNPLCQSIGIILKKIKFDLIYYRYNSLLIGQISLILSIIFKKPLIIEIGGVPWEEVKGLRSLRFFRKLYLLPLKFSKTNIFYSKEIRDEILKYIKIDVDKNVIIPCGVDDSKAVIKDKNSIRLKYGIDSDINIFSFCGSIDKWQGLDIALEACKNLNDSGYKDYIFIIVGGGGYLDMIRALACKLGVIDNIVFTGKISNAGALDYINLSDFCLAPFKSYRKTSPLKIFEYGACGKITLSSDIPDVRALDLDENLIYFTSDSSASLFDKLKEILTMKNKDSRYDPHKIRERVIAKYSWKVIIKKIIEEVINPFFSERR